MFIHSNENKKITGRKITVITLKKNENHNEETRCKKLLRYTSMEKTAGTHFSVQFHIHKRHENSFIKVLLWKSQSLIRHRLWSHKKNYAKLKFFRNLIKGKSLRVHKMPLIK